MAEVAGRYRLGDVIGVGSFATVHRATDDWLDSTVVVKILAENHSLNPEIRERFIGEGRSLRKISSPHVVAVHDIGETARQQPYLVLEYADRGTLAERVRSLRERSWTAFLADALALARGLATAVEAVHAAGLVHRDLSPGNVLLATDGAGRVGRSVDPDLPPGGGDAALVAAGERIIVADLGLCKDLALNSGLTVAGGTHSFRPPEQRGGPALVDQRADLWAMSRLLVWATEHAQLPPAFTAALHRSLADDPAARHPDVAAWLADVTAALAPAEPRRPTAPATGTEASVSSAPSSSSTSTAADTSATSDAAPARPPGPLTGPGGRGPDGKGRTRRRRRGLLAALVAVALVVGGAAGAVLTSWIGATSDHTANTSVSIAEPETVAVGEEASFTAAVEGADTWVWVLPDGRYVVDEARVSVTPTGAGTAEVILRARDGLGAPIETVQRLSVTDS